MSLEAARSCKPTRMTVRRPISRTTNSTTTLVSSLETTLEIFLRLRDAKLTVLLTIHRVPSDSSSLSLSCSHSSPLSSLCDHDAPSYQALVSLARPRHNVWGALSFGVFSFSFSTSTRLDPFLRYSFVPLSFPLSRVLGGNAMQTRRSSPFFTTLIPSFSLLFNPL